MKKLFDIGLVFTQIPNILVYLNTTLTLTFWSMLFGLVLGLVFALIKIKKVPVLRQITAVFVSLIRGTPVLVQLYVSFFGIPILLKAINLQLGTSYSTNNIPPILFAIAALEINGSAYMSESIRAALESVDKGQIEAASSLGMTYPQALWRIIIPEASIVAIPSLGNSLISLLKETSLAFVCAVIEITAAGKIVGAANYRFFEAYVSLAIIYWIISILLEQGIRLLEHLVQVPEKPKPYRGELVND